MITLNLKEQDWNPYEGYGKYGYISSQRFPEYEGYYVSIIDDVTEKKRRRMVGLIHVSPSVRVIQDLEYIKDLQYLSFPPGTHHADFLTYPKIPLTAEESLSTLREIFYKLEPDLQVRDAGGFAKGPEHNPYLAQGTYLLNDEELYFLSRFNGKITYRKGGILSSDYPFAMPDNPIVLAEEEIDYDLYKLSMEYSRLKNQISLNANKLLRSGELSEMVNRFNDLEKQIDKQLKDM